MAYGLWAVHHTCTAHSGDERGIHKRQEKELEQQPRMVQRARIVTWFSPQNAGQISVATTTISELLCVCMHVSQIRDAKNTYIHFWTKISREFTHSRQQSTPIFDSWCCWPQGSIVNLLVFPLIYVFFWNWVFVYETFCLKEFRFFKEFKKKQRKSTNLNTTCKKQMKQMQTLDLSHPAQNWVSFTRPCIWVSKFGPKGQIRKIFLAPIKDEVVQHW